MNVLSPFVVCTVWIGPANRPMCLHFALTCVGNLLTSSHIRFKTLPNEDDTYLIAPIEKHINLFFLLLMLDVVMKL